MSTVRQLYLDPSDVESERHQEIRLVKQYFDNVDSATVRQLYLDSSDVESERLQEIQLVKRYLDTVDSTGVNRVKTEVDKFVNRRAVRRPLNIWSENVSKFPHRIQPYRVL